MPDLDPGLAIVLTVGVCVLATLAANWHLRRATIARREALRDAPVVTIDLVSTRRTVVIQLALLGPLILASPFVAMALGRGYALEFVVGLIALVFVILIGLKVWTPAWVRVGRVVLDGDALFIEEGDTRVAVDLDGAWSFGEGLVPDGPEIVVGVSQRDASVVFRYGLLFGEEGLAEGLPVVAPSGVALGPEGLVIHERLRARRTNVKTS